MKLVSCSECFGLFPFKKTVIIEHKRVCHGCKSKTKGWIA